MYWGWPIDVSERHCRHTEVGPFIYLIDTADVTNYVHHYSAHDHQRHVTRIPEESRAPRSDHKTLYRPSPPPLPIVDLPHMLHASAPLANPQTARTFHCALTLRMRSYALACMPVLPPILHREEPRPCICPRSRCTFLHP